MSLFSTSATPYFFQANIETPAIKKLRSFLKMEDGWYYGMGIAPSKADVQNATLVANTMEWQGYDVEVFPGENGEILVSGKIDDALLNIEIEGSSAFALDYRSAGKDAERENFPAFDALLTRIWSLPYPCSIYGLSIPHGGVNAMESFATMHSSRQAQLTEEGFPLSIKNAPVSRRERRANTLENITSRSIPHQSSSGDSMVRYFPVTTQNAKRVRMDALVIETYEI